MRNGEFLKQSPQGTVLNYVVEDLIPAGRVILVASHPGEGKSFYALCVLYSVAYGMEFLGKKTRMGPVLLFDNDNPRDGLVSRILRIRQALEEDWACEHADIDIQHRSGFKLDDEGTWNEARRVIEDIKPVLIVLDHLRCFHDQDEDRSRSMQKVAEGIERLAGLCGSAVMVLHHFGKGSGNYYQRLRGSSVIYAKSEAAFEIRALSRLSNGGLEKFGLIEQPRKEKVMKPIRVRIVETCDTLKLVSDGEFEPVDDPELDGFAHHGTHILFEDRKPKTVNNFKDVFAGLCSDAELRKALRILPEKGIAKVERHGTSHKLVYVPNPDMRVCPWCGFHFTR